MDLALQLLERGVVCASRIHLEPRLLGDRIDREPAAHAAHGERRPAGAAELETGESRRGARGGVHRIRRAECRPAMPARPPIRDAKATRAKRGVHDAVVAGAVERDDGERWRVPGEIELGSAEISRSFLARRRHELDGARERRAAPLDHARKHQHCRESASVVADTGSYETGSVALDREIRVLGKHRVEMRADHHRLASICTGGARDDVAGIVDRGAQPDASEVVRDPPRAPLLGAGRRRDLRHADLRAQNIVVILGEPAPLARQFTERVGGDVSDAWRHAFNLSNAAVFASATLRA